MAESCGFPHHMLGCRCLEDGAPEPTREMLLSSVRNQRAWVAGLLQHLKGQQVKDERGYVVNSFAAAVVPDWELRQHLQWLEDTLAGKQEVI